MTVTARRPAHAPAEGFRSGDRHGWIDALTRRLERVATGRAAQELLDLGALPRRCAVAALPVWAWAPPVLDVGAKSRARDGGTLSMPVRLEFAGGPVRLLAPGSPARVSFTAVGLGHRTSGQATLHPVCPGGPRVGEDGRRLCGGIDSLHLPERLWYPVLAGAQVRAELSRLAEEGHLARWEVVTSLERHVASAVGAAARRVSAEIGGPVRELDETALAGLADELVLGTGQGPGPVLRMVDRALEPGRFARVDPQRWVRVTLARDAEQALRRRLADPWVGAKIRAVARELGTEDVEAVVREYNRRHPRDRVAGGRVTSALEASTDPITRHGPLPTTDGVPITPSPEEKVIAAVDRRRARAAPGARLGTMARAPRPRGGRAPDRRGESA